MNNKYRHIKPDFQLKLNVLIFSLLTATNDTGGIQQLSVKFLQDATSKFSTTRNVKILWINVKLLILECLILLYNRNSFINPFPCH